MTIATRIRQARKNAGLSQSRLAGLMGVTRSACSQWESAAGTVPRIDRLARLAALLDVSYEWLATGRAEQPRPGRGGRPRTRPDTLTREQKEVLEYYAALSTKARSALLELLRAVCRHSGA